ncbi:hypothetical protein RCJ22_15625 [Vibrio sp. FNV 38]|nr:hypothetical protein [Vibrio sp. FNV 38]
MMFALGTKHRSNTCGEFEVIKVPRYGCYAGNFDIKFTNTGSVVSLPYRILHQRRIMDPAVAKQREAEKHEQAEHQRMLDTDTILKESLCNLHRKK